MGRALPHRSPETQKAPWSWQVFFLWFFVLFLPLNRPDGMDPSQGCSVLAPAPAPSRIRRFEPNLWAFGAWKHSTSALNPQHSALI